MSSTIHHHHIQAGHPLSPVPLAGIDLNSGYMPVQRVFYFAGTPDISRLQNSLSTALAQWPDFSGTIAMFNGTPHIQHDDIGVPFTVETFDEPLPAFGVDHALGLPNHFCNDSIGKKTGDGLPVFTVKITGYNNHHWVLGICNSHALCDGSGYWQFMQSWIDAFHGKTLPAVQHSVTRYAGLTQRQSPTSMPCSLTLPNPSLAAQQIKNLDTYQTRQLLLTTQELDSLKTAINTELAGTWVSTADALMALLWQCLAKASLENGKPGEQLFSLGNVLNARQRLQLKDYTGNMAIHVSSQATCDTVAQLPLPQLALQLRQDTSQLADNDIHQFLHFLQEQMAAGHYNSRGYFTGFSSAITEACVYGNGIMINNWSKFPAYAMDFSGQPLWFDLATIIPMHFAMLMPAKNGIVLRLFLPETLMARTISLLKTIYLSETISLPETIYLPETPDIPTP